MNKSRKFSYTVEQYYPKFNSKDFFKMFVDHKNWSESDILPGEITIMKPGKTHVQGLGAVRKVVSGRMTIIEDIVGFKENTYFRYESRNGVMPVNDFAGELTLKQDNDGVLATYVGSFNRRYFGTGRLFRMIFRRTHQGAFKDLIKVYNSYYNL